MRIKNVTIKNLHITAAPAEIVQTGLQLYLDAGNSSSYPGSGSSWVDLITNNTFTLYGSPTYSSNSGGYIVFDANNGDYAESPTSLTTMTTWTIEAWHYYTGINTGAVPSMVTEVYIGGSLNYSLGTDTAGSNTELEIGYYDGNSGTSTGWHNTPPYQLTAGNWYHIVGTYDGTTLKLYVNGQVVQYSASSAVPVSQGAGIRLMRRWDNPDFWGGGLAVVRMYDRDIGQIGVTRNFDAERNRFIHNIVTTDLLFELDMKTYTSGTAWDDMSSNGNNFTFNSEPTVVNLGTDLAYWDNSSNWTFATSPTDVLPNGSYTKGIFVNTNAEGWGVGNLLSTAGGTDAFYFAGTAYPNAGHNGLWQTIISGTAVPSNVWVYLCVTFDTTSGWTMYLNGDVVATNSDTSPMGAASTQQVGAFQGSYGYYGKIAVAHEYTRALTQAEIQQNYNYYLARYNGATPA